MSRSYVDPWETTIKGPWRDSLLREAAPCHYGCGKPAVMTEPGARHKAHKACALRAQAIAEGRGPAPDVRPEDIIGWDGEDRDSKVTPRPLGCGVPEPGQTSGRACAGTGTELSCQLCPRSPTYWDAES